MQIKIPALIFALCMPLNLGAKAIMTVELDGGWNSYHGGNSVSLLQYQTQNKQLQMNQGNPYSFGGSVFFRARGDGSWFGIGFDYQNLGQSALRGMGDNQGGGATELRFGAATYQVVYQGGIALGDAGLWAILIEAGFGMMAMEGEITRMNASGHYERISVFSSGGESVLLPLGGQIGLGLNRRYSPHLDLRASVGYRFFSEGAYYRTEDGKKKSDGSPSHDYKAIPIGGPGSSGLNIDFSGLFIKFGLAFSTGPF